MAEKQIPSEPVDPEIVDAEVVEAPATPVPAEVPVASVPPAYPDLPAPDSVDPVDPLGGTTSPQYVVVEPPKLPRKQSNRGVGALLALVGALLYGALLAGATYLIGALQGAPAEAAVTFLADLKFYLPVLIFAVVFVVYVLLVNRARWWAYILGSLVIAAVVWFGTAAIGQALDLLSVRLGDAPETAVSGFAAYLFSPFSLVAAILAREVALWWGALIARRGGRLTARNALAREHFDLEVEEFRSRYGA